MCHASVAIGDILPMLVVREPQKYLKKNGTRKTRTFNLPVPSLEPSFKGRDNSRTR